MDSQGGGAGSSSNSSDFVRKLYKMLENTQDENVVRWGDNGDSFVVLENEKFTKHILPKHFKHSNFASFVRQLNKYDFHKVRHNNEESGQSPYGPGAWEFKHPDFKMNNKDALDNIRRKAPAPRKPNATTDDLLVPTQQIDMLNGQLVATQQQLQALTERYNELSMHHSMLLTEMIGVQKTVVNHEHVMQSIMSFLNNLDVQRRRESRIAFPQGQNGATINQQQMPPVEDDVPASPLQQAQKLLSEINADVILNPRNLEHMNEITMRMNGTLTTPPPDYLMRGGRPVSRGQPPNSASSTHSMRLDLENVVYPVGNNSNGIDPMYPEHVNNIPYPMPTTKPEQTITLQNATTAAANRKKSAQIDPGWTRQPAILLVEDDPTCRRIGGKFLYAFNCAIDSALDGLEAVNKMNAGSKYDLILMDIIMPNLDGVSACHLIRQFDSTPIIAMTSNIRSDDISMYFQHGMNDVLPKPFTKEGLLHMLEKHLAHLKKPVGMGMSQPTAMNPPPAVQPIQPLAHTSAQQSLKDEDSPAKSPASTNNWNSPMNTITGVSPVASSVTDEYSIAMANPAATAVAAYGVQPMQMQAQPGMAYQTSPNMTMGVGPPQPRGVHRRGISDISGGEGVPPVDTKRQMFVPSLQPQAINPMMRPR